MDCLYELFVIVLVQYISLIQTYLNLGFEDEPESIGLEQQ